MTAPDPSISLVELPRAANPEAVEVFVAAYQRDAEFARAFWAGDAVPAAALRALSPPRTAR